MIRRTTVALLLAGLAVGCSGQAEPPQPKLSDEQVKDLMKQGKNQNERERGGRPPGGNPKAP
ncbi:hypothetical protein J0H58_28390 [bacterium]|nr:hypothetical protein [bacterium]